MTENRRWAWPLVPLYWAGLRTKDALRTLRVRPVRKLRSPVISVGSLSAGGAGKTPVVIALAELLKAGGWDPDVLSRGFGRNSKGVLQVERDVPEGAVRFGDEPVLIANRASVPVWVGADRFQAGAAAEASHCTARSVHLLDDGFQHRQLGRELDVVLVTAEDLDDSLLPAGNRREPLSALRRAGVLVVREEEANVVEPRVRGLLALETPIWKIRRKLVVEQWPLSTPVVAFCGIARPQGFFSMLRSLGVEPIAEIPFPDHHRYTLRDVSRVAESCHLEGCRFVTTEKDAVKLGPNLQTVLKARGELHVARLEAEFVNPAAVAAALEARIG